MSIVRDNIVNFRVTPQERKRLEDAASKAGCRTLAEYVRSVLSLGTPGLAERVAGLESRMAALEISRYTITTTPILPNTSGIVFSNKAE